MIRYSTVLLTLVALLGGAPAGAQSSRTSTGGTPSVIETAPLVVMNLAAHPDDEDGSTLAYYRQGRDAIAYSVIYTRGEGGQNEIGPELYEALGAVRTDETLRASHHLGTQVFFLNFKDFGFSKSAAEAFDRWGGRDEVTSRIVYLIRTLKPDVLFTNHDTLTVGPNLQHGQHQAVGLTAYDAFELAADPSYHPEQLSEAGVDLWQPKRLYHRLWSGNGGAFDVSVPVGLVDESRNLSYAAMAAEGLHEHASQGMDMFAQRVARSEATYFELYRSAVGDDAGETDLAGHLPPNRSASPDLDYWIDSGRLRRLPAGAVTASDEVVVPGQRIRIRWDAGELPPRPIRLRLFGAVDTTVVLRDDSPPSDDFVVRRDHVPTVPEAIYQYERYKSSPPLGYVVYDARTARLLAGGYVDMDVAPPLRIEPAEEVVRLKAGNNVVSFVLDRFDAAIDSVTVAAALSRDSDRTVLDQHQISLDAASGRHSVSLRLPTDAPPGDYTLSLTALGTNGAMGAASADAYVRARVFEAEVPAGLRVGVVESYDNTLGDALTELGVDHVLLDADDLAAARFEGLHTIVVDIRAYLVREDLRNHNDLLMDWVRGGGHLIVNYQKTFEWNADQPDPFDSARNNPGTFAPYPIVLSHDRVTRETAPVTVLRPEHPVVTSPNRIRPADWEGWVQERGLYFPSSHDARYTELFSLHDPGEAPLTQSTLIADVGGGTYIYTALVWYRQLKEFHPGAFKVFANMISLPFTDGRATGL